MKIDTFNSSQPASVDLPTSDKNTSGVTGPVITSKSTWTVKNDARSQANDSRNSTSYGLNSTQTSPAKSRVTRAEEEPVLMAGEPWADFQERHYRWRLGIPRSEHVDRKLIPENEGTIPPRSVQEALFEGFIGFVLGGPGAGVRPGAPTLGPKSVPSPKLVLKRPR